MFKLFRKNTKFKIQSNYLPILCPKCNSMTVVESMDRFEHVVKIMCSANVKGCLAPCDWQGTMEIHTTDG